MSVKPSTDGRRAEKEAMDGRLEAEDIDTTRLWLLVNRRSKGNQTGMLQRPAGCKKSRIMANHDAADFNRGVLRFACGFKLDVDLGKLGGNIADFVVIFYSVEVGR